MCGRSQGLELGLYHVTSIDEPTIIVGLMDRDQVNNDHKASEAWELLRRAISQIQVKCFSLSSFEELYRLSYYLVMHKHGSLLYNGLREIVSDYINNTVKPTIINNLNGNLLATINIYWEDHQSFVLVISDVLMYVDRVYVRENGLDDIRTLCISLFKDLMVCSNPFIQPSLQETLLSLIKKERRGEGLMNRTAFKSTLQMLMILGNSTLDVYKENFEDPFLQESISYFEDESEKILKGSNALQYFRIIEGLINSEIERANHCYSIITRPLLEQLMEDKLIGAHMATIVEMKNSGIVHMIQNHKIDDLSRMYSLLGRVNDGLITMFICISHYLREIGQALVRSHITNDNALLYAQSLIDLKDRIDYYLINAFSNDKMCKLMIASDFEFILNCNPKSPEYLSLFIDEKLKKTVRGMTDNDRMLLLEKPVVMFRFLQDKDIFEQYYKQHLAKRLLCSKSINLENENSIISMFKAECGLHYTRKMEGMFRDLQASATLTDQFQKHVEDSGDPALGLELSVRVLTALYWPTYAIPPPLTMPVFPLTAFETFRKFYRSRHFGRQLTLLPSLGSAEIEAYFANPPLSCEDGEGHQSYLLQVSTYQMSILMAFNNRSRWTFQELQAETNMPARDLHRALQGLIQGKASQKVLIKQPETRKIDVHDIFYINVSFSSKTYKFKVPPLPAKCETEIERQDIFQKVTSNRNHEVEAAIIRIMKARRVINYDELLDDVMALLSARFAPSKDIVKTRLESLIERGYVVRNSEDRRVFEYVAA